MPDLAGEAHGPAGAGQAGHDRAELTEQQTTTRDLDPLDEDAAHIGRMLEV